MKIQTIIKHCEFYTSNYLSASLYCKSIVNYFLTGVTPAIESGFPAFPMADIMPSCVIKTKQF